MTRFLRARYEAELTFQGPADEARRAVAEDAGENRFFEGYHEEGDSFRLFLRRRFPFSILIAVPEARGTWKEGKLRVAFGISKMSEAVEWIHNGPAAVMGEILAAAGAAAGIPFLWKTAAVLALFLVLRQGLRTIGFWSAALPAVRRLEQLLPARKQ